MDFLSPSTVILAISITTFLIIARLVYLSWKVYNHIKKDQDKR